jgi:hypothetical protein
MAVASIFDRVVKNTMTQLPGALLDVVKLELFNVLEEFFNDTSIWKEDIELDITAGETEYFVTPEATNAARITRLERVESNDANKFEIKATMVEPGTIVLNIEPTTNQEAIAKVILTVGDPQDRDGYPFSPEWIVQKWYGGLVDGLIGKLMAQPAKPYTNERMSIFHTRKFESAKSQARAAARHTNLQGAQRWRFPQAFATTSRRG